MCWDLVEQDTGRSPVIAGGDRHISVVRTSVLKATMVRGTRALLIDRADLISEEHHPEINVSRRV